MPRIGGWAAAAFGAALALAQTGAGADAATGLAFSETYEVSFGGLRVARIEVTAEAAAAGYRADARVRPLGLADWIFDARIDATAEGGGSLAEPSPASLVSESVFDGEPRRIEITLSGGRPVALSVEPPYEPKSRNVAPDEAGLALDPLSAALALLAPRPAAEACGRSAPVYDGRRRYDLSLEAPRREGDGIRCEGRFTRIAGYKPKRLRERPVYPFSTRWGVEDGVAVLDQLMVEIDEGWVVANRR